MPRSVDGLLTLVCIAALSPSLDAQGTPRTVAAPPSAAGEIRGVVVEATTGAAIATGSITVRRASDSSFAGGALPGPTGAFRVSGLLPDRYVVRFRAIGFAPLVRSDVIVTMQEAVVDLGALRVATQAVTLRQQSVVADRPDVVIAPDRNSYAVKNMTTASGGTAVDVLRNVPSVEVDGTNVVSLRGSPNVVVQINGRMSPLRGEQLGQFLAQLPASAIRTVEVATNPSAKDDPEGTAGIINIVLNQETEQSLSGGLNAGTGTTGLASVSGNLGRQAGPWTLFGSYSIYRDERAMTGTSLRTTLVTVPEVMTRGAMDGDTHPASQTATLRTEYKVTPRDALSFDALVSGGPYARHTAADYENADPTGVVTGVFDQFSDVSQRSLSQDYALGFRHTGGPGGTTLSSDLRYTRFHTTIHNVIASTIVRADAITGAVEATPERDETLIRIPALVFQTDYSRPLGTAGKLDAGMKATRRSTGNDFSAALLDDASGTYVSDAARTSAFDYRETIGALYAVLSRRVRKLDGQLGLRAEEASTRLALGGADATAHDYASLFPSAILSYNATERRQVKLSYSRRITRPDPFQLSPIGFREDARNATRGNPALQPEYTNAVELSVQEARPWGSLQLTPYLRNTAHAVRFIRTVDTSGVSVGSFANVASVTIAGADLNIGYRRGPLSLNGGGGGYHYASDADTLSTRAVVWSARINPSLKLSPTTDLQLGVSWRGPIRTEGGVQDAYVYTSLAVRRLLWGDKGSITLRVTDPFNWTRFGFESRDARVIEHSERGYGARGAFLSFSRSFGTPLKLRSRPQEEQPAPLPGQGP